VAGDGATPPVTFPRPRGFPFERAVAQRPQLPRGIVTDDELMERIRDGEVERLELLFERHHVALYRFFRRLVGDATAAEDLVQEVFVRLLKYRHAYRSAGTFRGWLYSLARHAAFDLLERRGVERARQAENRPAGADGSELDLLDRLPDLAPSAQDGMVRDQEAALLRRALDELPAEKRAVLVLSRYRELRYEEIAEMLGTSVGAIKVRVHRALKDLRRHYLALAGEAAR
jgi:RNA polymerase sigma factor (sigma-70 family)